MTVTAALNRALREARAGGKIGAEHEPLIALARLQAAELDGAVPASALAPVSRAYVSNLAALGLVPPTSAPSELDALLAELRGDD